MTLAPPLTTSSARAVVPHRRAFLADALTPLGAYRRLAALSPLRFLLESVTGGEHVSRYSFLGAAPSELLLVHADRVESARPAADGTLGERVRLPGAPLVALRERIAAFGAPAAEAPFTGGWVGVFGWDLARLVEPKLARPGVAAVLAARHAARPAPSAGDPAREVSR